MVVGWATATTFKLDASTAIAFAGLGALLATGVLTLEDLSREGDTLVTFVWLAVLFALSGQLNELGFMGYVGERLALGLDGLSWPVAYVALLVLYILMHYLFVSQSSQVLALFGVFLDVGVRGGVPPGLMAFALLFASSYFSASRLRAAARTSSSSAAATCGRSELYRLGAADHGVQLPRLPRLRHAVAAARRWLTPAAGNCFRNGPRTSPSRARVPSAPRRRSRRAPGS